MSNTAVVADSIACLTKEQVQKYGIKIVPINIFFGGKIYRDWIDLSPAEGYALLDKDPRVWKSSAPSPEDFLQVYQELSTHAQTILVVTLSSKLSMCCSSAQTAKEIAKEQLPQITVEVLDSETVTAAEGFIALAAARVAAEGKAFTEVITTAQKVKERVKFIILLETTRHVYRTGRIPKIASQIGSVLPVKPILTVSDGLVRFATASRTKSNGVEKMLRMMKEQVGTSGPIHVAVMHADVLKEAQELKERIGKEFNCAELFITDFSPVMGYATGRGTLGFAFYKSL